MEKCIISSWEKKAIYKTFGDTKIFITITKDVVYMNNNNGAGEATSNGSKFCTACGTRNSETAKFCCECGKPL